MMSELKSGNKMMSGVNDDVHVQKLPPFSAVNDRLFFYEESTFIYSENDRLFSDDESTTLTNGVNQTTRAITEESQQVTTQHAQNSSITLWQVA